MTTLIIGAGLIGSQIARILAERGEKPVLMDYAAQPQALGEIVDLARVTLIEGDILKPFALMKTIADHGVSAIVHTAANPMLTLGAQRDPYSAVQLNIMGTMNVLEAARIRGIKRVVVSSSNVLGHFLAGGDGPGSGDKGDEEGFPRPTTFYAASKQAVESLGLNYARWCGIEFAGMRYGAVFGPWSGLGGGGPSNTMREALRRALAGEEAVVPAGAIEWVYSKDAAMGTVLALKATSLGSGIFNITMGSITKPDGLVAAIEAVAPGARTRIETPSATAVSLPDMKTFSNIGRAKSILGYAPAFDMVAGLRDMAAWMRPGKR